MKIQRRSSVPKHRVRSRPSQYHYEHRTAWHHAHRREQKGCRGARANKGKQMSNKFNAKSTADEVLSGVDLKGKRFLVTGASSGIGLETVRSLAAHGASVVAAVRDLAKAQAVTASIHKSASR